MTYDDLIPHLADGPRDMAALLAKAYDAPACLRLLSELAALGLIKVDRIALRPSVALTSIGLRLASAMTDDEPIPAPAPKRSYWEIEVVAEHDFGNLVHQSYWHGTETQADRIGHEELAKAQAADPEWARSYDLIVRRMDVKEAQD